MTPFFRKQIILTVCLAPVLLGCAEGRKGEKAEVSGIVKLDGTPVADA